MAVLFFKISIKLCLIFQPSFVVPYHSYMYHFVIERILKVHMRNSELLTVIISLNTGEKNNLATSR